MMALKLVHYNTSNCTTNSIRPQTINLVIGPYDQWGGQRRALSNLMGYEIDPVANISMSELAYELLDYILKDKSKPTLLKDNAHYQLMGANIWKHAMSLDKINSDTLIFYLNDNTLTQKNQRRKYFELKQ